MLFESLTLIALGLAVGLSGAVIPGPLFAFTVYDTCRKGKVTGHYIIAGHIVWELVVIFVIIFGFGWLIQENSRAILIIGGVMMAFMAFTMLRSKNKEAKMDKAKVNSSIGGGFFYSAFNPTQPIWWATAGIALLATGINMIGFWGIALVTFGHWLSDFAYYAFVSYVVHRYQRFINPKQKLITIVLALFLLCLGIFFIVSGIGVIG